MARHTHLNVICRCSQETASKLSPLKIMWPTKVCTLDWPACQRKCLTRPATELKEKVCLTLTHGLPGFSVSFPAPCRWVSFVWKSILSFFTPSSVLGPRDTAWRAMVGSVPSPESHRGVNMSHRGEQMQCEKDITVSKATKMSFKEIKRTKEVTDFLFCYIK